MKWLILSIVLLLSVTCSSVENVHYTRQKALEREELPPSAPSAFSGNTIQTVSSGGGGGCFLKSI